MSRKRFKQFYRYLIRFAFYYSFGKANLIADRVVFVVRLFLLRDIAIAPKHNRVDGHSFMVQSQEKEANRQSSQNNKGFLSHKKEFNSFLLSSGWANGI